jgi:2-(1,2-epoxy-1,2-dihydrophenyl)acetyl-CoA isomerase
MAHEAIQFEKRGHVAVLTLNRPERLNAISPVLRDEVHEAVGAAHGDDAVRALVVTGAGRGFCSGVDLTGAVRAGAGGERPPASQNDKLDEMAWVGRWAKLFFAFDKPVIAAVNGVAAGAGMSMALAADLRVGCENTRFKTVFIERSLSPDSGMSYFLPRIVGYARAADLIFTSRAVDAEEAYRLGLIDRLVEADALVAEAVKLAEEMSQWPPLALRVSKRVLQHNLEAPIEEALRYETMGLSFARRASNDARESFLAFSEKRKPTYTGD